MDRKATEFGIYDQLKMELRNEDPASFTNFLRIPRSKDNQDAYMVQGVPLPDLKLSLTVRQLCLWGQVCNATIDEYKNEVLAVPKTPEGCHAISNKMEPFWPSSACHLDPQMRLTLGKPPQCLQLASCQHSYQGGII